ncbi:MAG: DUF3750 domain-containing protein [Salaquimonas sp.]
MRAVRKLFLWIFILFLLPALGAVAWWAGVERPGSWREANWTSANILPNPSSEKQAVVYIMSARTGGLKGALSQHSWIVTKAKNASQYDRYDKVGWGNPVRKNAYAADANWYSNRPKFVKTIKGDEAANLIPKIERAIQNYPHANRGGYKIWPGPNSNSFVAHVLRQVPQIGIVLPSNAVGRDYIAGNKLFYASPDGLDYELSLFGYAGLAAGYRSGFEFNFFGLVTGVDVINPAIKLPGFGRIGIREVVAGELLSK